MHVAPVCTIDEAAMPTLGSVRSLKVIRTRDATMSGANLAVSIHRTDLDRGPFTASPLAVRLGELDAAQ